MTLIKIFSLILLLPSIFFVTKLIKKEDLNFFDFLLIFNTLYFVIIPLKSNQVVFDSIGRLSKETSFTVFLYLFFFFISLLIASYYLNNKSYTVLNITKYLKNYPTVNLSFSLNIILIVIPIFSLLYYVPKISVIDSFSEIRENSANVSYEASSMVKLFSSIFSVSLIIALLIFFQNIKKKKFQVSNVISLLIFLVNLLLLSRRQLLLYFVFAAILLYSFNRELINKKFIFYVFSFGMFMYFIYFPFYNIIRRTPVEFKLSSPIVSIIGIYEYGVNSFEESREDSAESTDSRAIGLYRALYWLARSDSEDDITWGAITLAAIDHAIPRIINPGKGLGSEELLQRRMNTSNDSADSILLLAFADYSILGSIITLLIYYLVYRIWLLISNVYKFSFGTSILSFYFVFFLFRMTFSIEQKLDGILADTVAYILIGAIIVSLHKLKMIKLEKVQ